MTFTTTKETFWRATGPYVPTLASKSSLLDETKIFLDIYAQVGDLHKTSQALVNGALPQRSRRTRSTIVGILRMRLVRWNPPVWVLDDLVAFARDPNPNLLCLALLAHIARQDCLLYDFVQQVIVPRWCSGIYKVIRSDVQGFLDKAQEEHTEITHWSYTTRERLSNSVLTVLRDCKLLKGEANKYIVAPLVSPQAVRHLVHLLVAEGVAQEAIPHHADWKLWLWDSTQTQKAIDSVNMEERMAWMA